MRIDHVVDSCVLFDFFKDRNEMRRRLQRYELSKIVVSRVSILEILKHQNKLLARQQVYEVSKLFRLNTPSESVWAESARSLKDWPGGDGELPDIPDLVIGHTARLLGAKVLTMNVFDFKYIKGLEIVNPLDDILP